MIKILSILLLLTSPVLSHDWYSSACCSDRDCRPVPCEDLIELNNGMYQYKDIYFSKEQVHPSQDSKCHVCIHDYTLYGKVGLPVCAYVQQSY